MGGRRITRSVGHRGDGEARPGRRALELSPGPDREVGDARDKDD